MKKSFQLRLAGTLLVEFFKSNLFFPYGWRSLNFMKKSAPAFYDKEVAHNQNDFYNFEAITKIIKPKTIAVDDLALVAYA